MRKTIMKYTYIHNFKVDQFLRRKFQTLINQIEYPCVSDRKAFDLSMDCKNIITAIYFFFCKKHNTINICIFIVPFNLFLLFFIILLYLSVFFCLPTVCFNLFFHLTFNAFKTIKTSLKYQNTCLYIIFYFIIQLSSFINH